MPGIYAKEYTVLLKPYIKLTFKLHDEFFIRLLQSSFKLVYAANAIVPQIQNIECGIGSKCKYL